MTGRELWRIGDWGGASMWIGRHWEEVGASALGALVGRASPLQPEFVPRAAVSFVDESACELAVQRAGLSHPDALLIGPLLGRLALQAVDFKWSLEVAQPGQVTAETLQALLEAEIPAVQQALLAKFEPRAWGIATASGKVPKIDQLALLDGLFLAPDHAANHAFLQSRANQVREQPIEPRQVVLEPVSGPGFFSPLPGWDVGAALAAQEGARRAVDSLEGAEHYYRLGAGVRGALIARKRSIFDPEPPQVDALAELGSLRRARRLMTTEQLIAFLDRSMAARGELVKSLGQVGRKAYPFSSFRAALVAAGVRLPDRSESGAGDRRWSRLFGLVQREISGCLAAEGRELVAAGQSDAQALATLSSRSPVFGRQAQEIAARLIAAEADQSPVPRKGLG